MVQLRSIVITEIPADAQSYAGYAPRPVRVYLTVSTFVRNVALFATTSACDPTGKLSGVHLATDDVTWDEA